MAFHLRAVFDAWQFDQNQREKAAKGLYQLGFSFFQYTLASLRLWLRYVRLASLIHSLLGILLLPRLLSAEDRLHSAVLTVTAGLGPTLPLSP